MQTRRQLLQQVLALPLVMPSRATAEPCEVEIISDSDCLSQESAEGFRSLQCSLGQIIVLCGISALSRQRALELRNRALGAFGLSGRTQPGAALRKSRFWNLYLISSCKTHSPLPLIGYTLITIGPYRRLPELFLWLLLSPAPAMK